MVLLAACAGWLAALVMAAVVVVVVVLLLSLSMPRSRSRRQGRWQEQKPLSLAVSGQGRPLALPWWQSGPHYAGQAQKAEATWWMAGRLLLWGQIGPRGASGVSCSNSNRGRQYDGWNLEVL